MLDKGLRREIMIPDSVAFIGNVGFRDIERLLQHYGTMFTITRLYLVSACVPLGRVFGPPQTEI